MAGLYAVYHGEAGIRRIAVATQYKAHSLIRHMQRGWNFLRPERNESFDILPASQRVSELQWYEGTADAVYQNIDIIESYAPRYMVILAGDHIYKMDYELMLQQHVNSGADVTIGCLEVPRMEATGFGVMAVDVGRHVGVAVGKLGLGELDDALDARASRCMRDAHALALGGDHLHQLTPSQHQRLQPLQFCFRHQEVEYALGFDKVKFSVYACHFAGIC